MPNNFSNSFLFELKALIEDEKINAGFLKKLVLDYSVTERKLIEAIKQKNYILGVAAHDIRNPLASIKGISELLKDGGFGELNDSQMECVELINLATQDLLDLLSDLLDLSAVSNGSVVLKMEMVDLSRLIKQRVHFFKHAASNKNMEIIFEDFIDDFYFHCDKGKITQVIDNLISNAIKYSYPKSAISMRFYKNDGKIIFEISDNGPGIPKGEEQHLFGAFKKLNVEPTGGEKSTGLGLAISKKIIEAHTGDIYGRNNENGKGAVFGFSIPDN